MHPILFTIGGQSIAALHVFIVLAILACHPAVYWAAQRRGIDDRTIQITAVATVIAGFLGTRVMTGFVYWVSRDQSAADLRLGLGAMSDTGVWVFAEIVIALVAWRLRQNPLLVLDAWAFAAAIASPIGRIGCLLAGCCYGQGTTLPWGLHYPHDHEGVIAAGGLALHPTPLYMSLGVFSVWLVLGAMIRRRTRPGSILLTAWAGYALVRFTVEFFRADVARGSWFAGTLTTYQLIVASALALHVLLALVLWRRSLRAAPE